MQVPVQIDPYHDEIVRRIAKRLNYRSKRVRSLVVRNMLERFDILLTPEMDEMIVLVDRVKDLCGLIDQSPMQVIAFSLNLTKSLKELKNGEESKGSVQSS